MVSSRWHSRGVRIVTVGGAFALGAFAVLGLRGNAGQTAATPPPINPPAQALDMQNAFEQVAGRLRPSVVFIQSRQTLKSPIGMRSGADDGGDDDSPFGFNFPGFPGFPLGPGMRQFRMMPSFPRRAVASGSGVIVRGDGYILTNDHVVNGADKVTVRLQDGREFTGQVKRDFRSDLALVKIDATGLPAAEMADSDKVKVGQWAIAFGAPFGLSDTMTVGIVSSLNREQAIGGGGDQRFYPRLIQTDASINPGNSGGPLVDIYGRVIGINVAIESPSGGNVGIGFAIPANTAKYIMEQLITKGSVTRGYLGLAPKTLNYDEQQRYGVKEGALVMSVEDGTPAAKAGFQVEDVIVRFNGQAVKDDADLRDMVARTAPGTRVPVVVRRNNAERTLNVTVGTVPDTQVARNDSPARPDARAKLGVSVADANDPQVRQQLGLKGQATPGAVVVEVIPGSPAAAAGLQPGDIITRLDGKTINSASQLTEAVRGLKSDASVNAVVRRGNQTVLAQIDID
ncbi:MAG TPA: PDZ domain-containing protein [Chthonomonadaceae bacterium]|nr:PDZ domain-containing protein [Chthonomonadaceae bacterium]